MRFMMIVKAPELTVPPPKELLDAMDKLIEETMKAGEIIETGGLAPTAAGSRVRLTGGKLTVIDGPFTEAKEVLGGYALFELKSKEEAIERSRRFMDLHRIHWPGWEGECEIRQVFLAPQLPVRR
jgi:hypothetical protein